MTPFPRPVKCRLPRGNSSVGRARPCQGRGREFESRFPLQVFETPARRGLLFPDRAMRLRLEGGLERRVPVTGQVAEWSCSGLQIRVRRFDSDPGLQAHQQRVVRLRRFHGRISDTGLVFNEALTNFPQALVLHRAPARLRTGRPFACARRHCAVVSRSCTTIESRSVGDGLRLRRVRPPVRGQVRRNKKIKRATREAHHGCRG